MVTIVCEVSGIEFEAATRRTKQHPKIAELKQRAFKDGTGRELGDVLGTVRKSGGYTTIDEFITLVENKMKGVETYKMRQIRYEAERREDYERVQRERNERNALLKANGYTWHAYELYEEDDGYNDRPFADNKRFYLESPDGEIVSVSQALDEIKRGRDVVRAEIAAREAKYEAEQVDKDAAAAKIENHNRLTHNLFDAALHAATDNMAEVEDAPGFIQLAVIHMGQQRGRYTNRGRDKIMFGTVNGVPVVITLTRTGYDDDGYYGYVCADPATAGLTVYEPDEFTKSWRDIFGA